MSGRSISRRPKATRSRATNSASLSPAAHHPRRPYAVRQPRAVDHVGHLHEAARDVAVGFVHATRASEGLEGLQAAAEPFVACLPEQHALARSKRVTLRALAHEPFILFARAASPAYYERVIGLCVASGFQPDVRYEARNWLTVVGLVAKGMGVAVVPQAVSASGMRGCRFAPLKASSILSNSWCVWNPNRQVPPLTMFLQMAKAKWAKNDAAR